MANPTPVLMPQFHTVFVDTSLDTHLAMPVEEFDTVSDFKKKIQREHVLCFPDIGEIGINALQVKRRGFLYHLSDSMYVRKAFEGVKCRWFVYVDACILVKQGLEISEQGNGILRLEHGVRENRMGGRVNEADKCMLNLQKDVCLNGKKGGDAAGDAVMKVLEDLEIDFEQLGDYHLRTSSSETNRRVESEFHGTKMPNSETGQNRQLGKKRKIEVSENPVDNNLLNVDVSIGHENEAITAKKRRKSEKKNKGSVKWKSTKTSKSTVDASFEGARTGVTVELLSVTNSCVNNTDVGMLQDPDLVGHKALRSAPTADGKLEFENGQINVDHLKDQSHVSRQPIRPTNVLSVGIDTLHPCSANEDSLIAKTIVDGKHLNGPDPATATVTEVSTERKEPSTKHKKKKKTKSKTLLNQLHTDAPFPVENNDKRTDSQFTDSADKVNVKIPGTQNTEEHLCEKQFCTGEASSIDKKKSLPESSEKMSLKNQKPGDSREKYLVVEAPELLQSKGEQATLKSEKKAKKEKKQKDGSKKKKTKPVTEGVEATQCEILSDQIAGNIGSKSESTNISRLGLDKKTDELVEALTDARHVMDNVIGTGKLTEVRKEAPQLKGSSDLAIDKGKKWSKRTTATNPSEIREQEKVINPSQSTYDISCKDKSAGGDKGVTENAEKNNCKKATSVGSTVTAHAPQAEVVKTNPLVDDNTKDNKLSSDTEEINFSDYFVQSQQKPEFVSLGDAGNVNDERTAVKDTTEDSTVKNKSAAFEVGKKSQVGSSQESLSILQPHGVVLHSDTESFRVPKDRKLSTSSGGKQKSKSNDNKSKQISSEIATLHSPSASETQKSFAKSKEKAETFTAPNSTLKSTVGLQQTKSKKSASKKSSTAKIKKAENSAIRRKTLLSANIFKDDNNESSEDEQAVTSVQSAGTFAEDTNVSDVSEMEDNTGFATPITVGQRKAAEVENDSSQNKYTLEKLRASARLEKEKRAQELGIPLEDFVPDSQAEVELME